jgi:hypothetical protein
LIDFGVKGIEVVISREIDGTEKGWTYDVAKRSLAQDDQLSLYISSITPNPAHFRPMI